MSSVLNITQSITGQAWQWRSGDVDARDPGFRPDDLVTQLLMARGVPRDDLERHRDPTIRGFMPDPSIFQDMDRAAERLADAVQRQEPITVYGDYDVDGATSAALLIRLFRSLGLTAGHYIPDRLMEGYGPSGEALVRIGEGGSKLIVTVDCGAMAYDSSTRTAWTRPMTPHRTGISPLSVSPSCWGRPSSAHFAHAAISPAAPNPSSWSY
jgi:single-stranded-DNA-specific exonuclease